PAPPVTRLCLSIVIILVQVGSLAGQRGRNTGEAPCTEDAGGRPRSVLVNPLPAPARADSVQRYALDPCSAHHASAAGQSFPLSSDSTRPSGCWTALAWLSHGRASSEGPATSGRVCPSQTRQPITVRRRYPASSRSGSSAVVPGAAG